MKNTFNRASEEHPC